MEAMLVVRTHSSAHSPSRLILGWRDCPVYEKPFQGEGLSALERLSCNADQYGYHQGNAPFPASSAGHKALFSGASQLWATRFFRCLCSARVSTSS